MNSNHIKGCRLTHEQTRWIFETKTIGEIGADVPVDDIVETANHFRAADKVIMTAKSALTEGAVFARFWIVRFFRSEFSFSPRRICRGRIPRHILQ